MQISSYFPACVSVSIEHHEKDLDLVLLINPQTKKTFNDWLEYL